MNKVAVLMSTYNGEKYLREQIDSILAQKGDFELDLYVRDDGSKDNTIEILKEYEVRSGISWYQGNNYGAAKSFIDLIRNTKGYDFYAFADQDDYWIEDKIERAISKINKDIPMLYCGNGIVVNEKLEDLGNFVYSKQPSLDFNTVLCAGGLLGCTMVFNDKLAQLIRDKDMPDKIVMHDFYIALICAGIGGKVVYDNVGKIKYRQHGGNVVGVSYGVMGKIKNRIRSITKKQKVSIQDQANAILERYEDVILSNNMMLLKQVASYKKGFISRLKLALSRKTKYVNWNKCITLRLSILLGNR